MTQEQFRDIQEKLRVLREYRCLSVGEQRKNFDVNYSKELTKFFEAKRDNNEYGIIKALCDMIVVCVNAGGNIGCASCEFTNINLTYPIIYRSIDIKGLLYELRREGYDPYKCLLEAIKELETHTGQWNGEKNKWVEDLGAYTQEEAWNKSYRQALFSSTFDISEWLLISEDDLFWVFGCSEDEHPSWFKRVKKWYKADYDKCKLESVE